MSNTSLFAKKNFSNISNLSDHDDIFASNYFVPSYNKTLLTDLNINNTIRFMNVYKLLPYAEQALVSEMIRLSPLKNGEHDLAALKYNGSNEYLAAGANLKHETTRISKEALQARGIFLIDGREWTPNRGRPQTTQQITFTPKFIEWFKKTVSEKSIQPFDQFGYCVGYVEKREERRRRMRIAKMVFNNTRKFIINVIADTSLAITTKLQESVPPRTDSDGTYEKIENQNNEYTFKNAPKFLSNGSIKSKLTNGLLASLSTTHKENEYKQIGEATIKFCSSLLKSGLTKIEVARHMIKNGYVKTVEDFEKRILPEIIAHGS